MPTQYGELKNGLRAYVTYSVKSNVYYYNDGDNPGYYSQISVTNGGIVAPAPISKDIKLAAGTYELTLNGGYFSTLDKAAHTFVAGNTDRWFQVFLNAGMREIRQTKATQTATVKVRRSTSPIYQTIASFSIPPIPSAVVSYNANGGTGAPSAQTKWYGETLTLSSTRPTRTGYTFAGWATSSSGSVAYQPGGSYTANSAATLYAKWTPISVTLSYNANGGS